MAIAGVVLALKVLVTGGAGFIGSNLVFRLVEEGFDVYVVDCLHTGHLGNLKGVFDRVHFKECDVKDLLRLDLPRVDVVFHQGVYSSSPMYRENPQLVADAVAGGIAVLELAKRHGAKVVIASTSSIYNGLPLPWREDMQPIPFDFYTEARIAVERVAAVYSKLHDVPVVVLRYFSIYGPHEEFKGRYANVLTQMMWAGLKGEEFVIFGDGSQTRDLVYVGDVVEANLKAIDFLERGESSFEIFNVGSGKATSFNEMAELVRRLGLNLKTRYVENPIKNYVYHTLADTRKAEELLKFKAKTPLEVGARRTLEYYRKLYGAE